MLADFTKSGPQDRGCTQWVRGFAPATAEAIWLYLGQLAASIRDQCRGAPQNSLGYPKTGQDVPDAPAERGDTPPQNGCCRATFGCSMITTKTQPASSFLWLCIGNQPQRLARIEYEFLFLSVGAPRRALLERLNALPHFLVPGRRWRGGGGD